MKADVAFAREHAADGFRHDRLVIDQKHRRRRLADRFCGLIFGIFGNIGHKEPFLGSCGRGENELGTYPF
jgi:hypothetical protein